MRQMQVLARSIRHHGLSLPSRSPPLSFTTSALPHWWPPARARRDAPLMAASNLLARRVPRFPYGSRNMASSSGIKVEELGKPEQRPLIPSAKEFIVSLGGRPATTKDKDVENSNKTKDFIARYGYGHPAAYGEEIERTSVDASDGKLDAWGKKPKEVTNNVDPMDVIPNSSHCDGSIYRGDDAWKSDFRVADRSETQLEAMMLSNPTDCTIHDGKCLTHSARSMLQIFSLNLAKVDVYGGPVDLYGYIAARDVLDPLLNYVVNFSRDDPIIVEQGSLINMTGPKRGIELYETIILEYDMRIKTGKLEKDDLQLIDGVSIIDDIGTFSCHLSTNRIHGDCGVVDITIARFDYGVEVTVEVVFEVQSSFSLCFGCFSSRLDKEIRLFDGTIVESCGLRRSVVAVDKNSWMDLKFKIGSGSQFYSEHCCSFKAYKHGHENQLIKTDFASISVKVTWSVVPESLEP